MKLGWNFVIVKFLMRTDHFVSFFVKKIPFFVSHIKKILTLSMGIIYFYFTIYKIVCCWPDGGVEILQLCLSGLYWGYNDVPSTRKISLPANIVLCLHTWLPRVILTRNCQFSHHYWCHYIHIHTIYPPAGNNNQTTPRKRERECLSFEEGRFI